MIKPSRRDRQNGGSFLPGLGVVLNNTAGGLSDPAPHSMNGGQNLRETMVFTPQTMGFAELNWSLPKTISLIETASVSS